MEYYRIVKTERNMFTTERVTIEKNKVIDTKQDEPTYLPILVEKLKKKIIEESFKGSV